MSAYAPSAQQLLQLSATLNVGKVVAFPLLLLAAAILFVSGEGQVGAARGPPQVGHVRDTSSACPALRSLHGA